MALQSPRHEMGEVMRVLSGEYGLTAAERRRHEESDAELTVQTSSGRLSATLHIVWLKPELLLVAAIIASDKGRVNSRGLALP